MISSSMSEFILAMISAGCPPSARRRSPAISLRNRRRSSVGAITSFFSRGGSEYPVNALKNAVASSAIAWDVVRRPKSV